MKHYCLQCWDASLLPLNSARRGMADPAFGWRSQALLGSNRCRGVQRVASTVDLLGGQRMFFLAGCFRQLDYSIMAKWNCKVARKWSFYFQAPLSKSWCSRTYEELFHAKYSWLLWVLLGGRFHLDASPLLSYSYRLRYFPRLART